MPYSSDAQRRYFHFALAHHKKGFTPAMVNEYDKASKGMSLPEHAVKSGLDKVAKKKKKKKSGMGY